MSGTRISSVMRMPVNEARVAAAIKGALLADAASMGCQYGAGNPEAPEFQDPPTPVGYSSAEFPGHYEAGMLSPWGEQLLFALQFVAKEKAVNAGPMSVALMKWTESENMGYQDKGLTDFLTCMKAGDRSVELCGQDDDRACGFARIIPTVCLYAGEVDMVERVKETVMISQTNPRALRFCCAAAKILEHVLLGFSLRESMEEIVNHAMGSTTNFTTDDSEIGDACLFSLMEAKMKDLDQLVEALDQDEHGGNSARFPSAFEIPMYLFYKAMADGDIDEAAYIKAIRSNIQLGGETCLRSIVLGAVFGAAAGTVPASFVEKFPKETMETVDKAIAKICSLLN